ncbi:MAG: efflux RND transporter permease subunit [Bdellovibrionales bacterium]|nr:efflux RND transporter permease subunit [Bdellovibrionales bacterium]
MNLIEISIRRPVFAWVLMSAFIIFGAIAASRLGISQMPDVNFPIVDVSVTYEGAVPEIVETEIVDLIEARLLGLEGIKEMRSVVRQGVGSVRLEFDINRDVDVAMQEVQSALSQLRLPIGIDPPVVRKTNPEEEPIMFVGLWADKPLREVIIFAETFLLDQFRFIPNVGEVSIGGFSERNLRIWPYLKKMEKAEITVADILDTLTSQHIESSAGQFVEGDRELRVRWMGEASSVDEVRKLRILRRGNALIQDTAYTIGDVAAVEDGLSDVRRRATVGGLEALSISVKKQRGANEVSVANAVVAKMKELESQLPEGYHLRVNADFTLSTRAVVHSTFEKLFGAALVTILICFLFLGSWQAALNILFSIPTSIFGTFIILYFSGFTMNLFTLLALTLAISIVVDDSIMLLENIIRHFRMGKNPYQAAYDGAMEILPAATATTLAVIAVFLPVIFMDGITGKFFFQFGITMSAAVLISLLEAVTITPMRASAFMAASPKITKFEHYLDQKFEGFSHSYGSFLKRILPYSLVIVAASMIGFAASLLLVHRIKQEFIPPQDQNFIILSAQLPTGASLPATAEFASKIEAVLKDQKEIEGYFVSAGAGGPSAEVNAIFMPLYLTPKENRMGHLELMEVLRSKFKDLKGAKITLRDVSARNLTTGRLFPVSFNVKGPDLAVLREKADEMIKRLESEGMAQDMDTDSKTGVPELQLRPVRNKLAERGVSIDVVSRTLNSAIAGARQNRFTADGRRYDIRVKIPEAEIKSKDDVGKVKVRNQFGNLVSLADVVDIKEEGSLQSITRINRQRAVGVFGQLPPGKSQAVVLARAQQIADEILPDGYTFALEGAAAGLSESFKSLLISLLVGVLVAYMILAVQFNSFIHPVTVLMALPFSVTGALIALWGADVSLNLFSYIGLIVLMGIAKKNSIMLVEFTNQVRDQNKSAVDEALVEACPVRLRPILMTSAATVMAALPLVIGNGLGHETRLPMGLSIIGGTILSTILTLFVVPCLYRVLSRFENRKVIDFKPRESHAGFN